MTAYSITNLDNRVIQEQAAEAMGKSCISKEECAQVKARYPCDFYTPNMYMRIGLFLLTVVIAAFSMGLLAFMFLMAGSNGFGGLMLFSGLVCYIVLELIVRGKKHFRSGVDDALLWMSVNFVFSGLVIAAEPGFLVSYALLFILASFCWLRFTDRIMALVAYAALLGFVFYLVSQMGELGKIIMSFALMAVSAGVYMICARLSSDGRALFDARALSDAQARSDARAGHYQAGLQLIKAACLITGYAAGNYFVVREAGIAFFHWLPDTTVPLGWFFWVFTLVIPLLYLYYGIKKKDRVFLWVGLVLVAAAIFTIRHYYHILPIELAMVVGGILLIAIAYGSLRYLRTPQYGMTAAETDDRHWVESLHIESLIIAETFTAAAPPAGNDFQFGGGSGGGGGAGGQY